VVVEEPGELTRPRNEGESIDFADGVRDDPSAGGEFPRRREHQRGRAAAGRRAPLALAPVAAGRAITSRFTLGDFAIRREIGRGGMGVVYEAEQLSLGRRVALKVLSSAAALDVRSQKRFQIEARAAACLHHEHIVPVYAIGLHDQIPFYTMPYIEGASLAGIIAALAKLRERQPAAAFADGADAASALALDLLADRFGARRDEPMAPISHYHRGPGFIRAVVRLAAQAAEALEHAHEQGVLHRDIKPANLLLDRSGKLWITDFGLARILGSGNLTTTGDVPGTLRYMSPEQARGKRALVDCRSDVYALGATLYELLALEAAVEGRERWEILARIDREEPRPLRRHNPDVPVDLATIVAKAMAKDVSNRYQSAGEFAEDLGRFLDGRTIKARPASPWEHCTRWCRRNAVVTGLVTVQVVVFLIGLALVVVLWRQAHVETSRASEMAQARAMARAGDSKVRTRAHAENAVRGAERGQELPRRATPDRGLPMMNSAVVPATDDRPEPYAMAMREPESVGNADVRAQSNSRALWDNFVCRVPLRWRVRPDRLHRRHRSGVGLIDRPAPH
jgi:serine/threonine protein kinase